MRNFLVRLLMVILLLPFWGFTFLDPVAKKNQEGNDFFGKGEYDAALKRYLEAQQNAPSRSELRFNVGDALYKQGKYEEAAQELGRVVESDNQSLSAEAYYNLGNAFFRQEKYQEAVGAYKKSLMKNPKDQDAKVNLELALEKMQQQQQNQDNKQDQNQDNKQDQNQDQDKQQDQNQENKDQEQQQDQDQQEKQDQGNKEDQDQQDQEQKQQQDQDQTKDGQQNQDKQDPNADQQNPQQAQGQPGELTQEEAARILDAMKERDEASQKRRKIKVSGRRYNGNAW
jgi:Ca-activated chloride channel family protein